MSGSERILLALLAVTVTVAAAELVRREVVVMRGLNRWWPKDAYAIGALYALVGAVALWTQLVVDSRPAALQVAAGLAVIVLYVVLPDPRER